MNFKLLKPSEIDWQIVEGTYDSTCYHSQQWSNYLQSIGYHPVVIEIANESGSIGFFVGERLWRGVWLLTAPFEGIGTYTQGLVLIHQIDDNERVNIYKDLSSWVFNTGLASYLQVDDWMLKIDADERIPDSAFQHPVLDAAHVRYEVRPTLHVPMADKTIDELWANLHYKSAKYSINKATKNGLRVHFIDKIDDISNFIDIHYDQLLEVCAKNGMRPKPSQSKKRMWALCKALFPNRIVMVQVLGEDEIGVTQVMSSGLFCLDKGQCAYWTGASYQRYQKYCPNELMVWEAMKRLYELGGGDLNMCGMAPYKLKFGTTYAHVPRLIFTKYSFVYQAKTFAKTMYHTIRKVIATIKGKKSFK